MAAGATDGTADAGGALAPAPPGLIVCPSWGELLAKRADREAKKRFPLKTILVGVVAPPILFMLGSRTLYFAFLPHATLLMTTSIVLMLAWLVTRRREAAFHAFLVGPFFLGSIFAYASALSLLPLVVLAFLFAEGNLWIIAISLLGLIPLWTARAYEVAGTLAWRSTRQRLARRPAKARAILAALVVGGGIAFAGWRVEVAESRATAIVLGKRDGDPERAERVLRALYYFPQVTLFELEAACSAEVEEDPLRIPAGPMTAAFTRITGFAPGPFD